MLDLDWTKVCVVFSALSFPNGLRTILMCLILVPALYFFFSPHVFKTSHTHTHKKNLMQTLMRSTCLSSMVFFHWDVSKCLLIKTFICQSQWKMRWLKGEDLQSCAKVNAALKGLNQGSWTFFFFFYLSDGRWSVFKNKEKLVHLLWFKPLSCQDLDDRVYTSIKLTPLLLILFLCVKT